MGRKINASRKPTYQESVDVVQYNRFIVTECNTPAHCVMLNCQLSLKHSSTATTRKQVTGLRFAPSLVLDNTEQSGNSVYQEITIECLRLRPDNLMVCQPHEGGTIERFYGWGKERARGLLGCGGSGGGFVAHKYCSYSGARVSPSG